MTDDEQRQTFLRAQADRYRDLQVQEFREGSGAEIVRAWTQVAVERMPAHTPLFPLYRRVPRRVPILHLGSYLMKHHPILGQAARR